MYAVFKSSGKQFKVSPGDTLKIDRLTGKEGETIEFKDIVAVGNGDKFELGSPLLTNASVSAKLLHQTRDDKIRVFRKKRRKHFQRTHGHRQYISILKVTSIKSNIGEETYTPTKSKSVKKTESLNIEKKTTSETENPKKNITKEEK